MGRRSFETTLQYAHLSKLQILTEISIEHKQKKRQIATWVCDVNYKRWRSYCPQCKKAEYP